MAKKRLLFISDETSTKDQLSQAFANGEFRTFAKPADRSVLFQISFLQPDLVILEMGRSKDAGREVLRGIRGCSFVPVIALLPPGDAMGIVETLNAGADQCLSESFVTQELQARVRALLRRAEATATAKRRPAPVPAL
jgi:two-component system OmpR family response regulator